MCKDAAAAELSMQVRGVALLSMIETLLPSGTVHSQSTGPFTHVL